MTDTQMITVILCLLTSGFLGYCIAEYQRERDMKRMLAKIAPPEELSKQVERLAWKAQAHAEILAGLLDDLDVDPRDVLAAADRVVEDGCRGGWIDDNVRRHAVVRSEIATILAVRERMYDPEEPQWQTN